MAKPTASTRSSSGRAGKNGADRTGFPPVVLRLSVPIGRVTGFAVFAFTKGRRKPRIEFEPEIGEVGTLGGRPCGLVSVRVANRRRHGLNRALLEPLRRPKY